MIFITAFVDFQVMIVGDFAGQKVQDAKKHIKTQMVEKVRHLWE